MPDYVVKNDAQFRDWMDNFNAVLNDHTTEVGLTATDMIPVETATGDFGTALTVHNTKQAEARSATAVKCTKRTDLEAILRPLVRRIDNHPGMTNELRAALGLNLKNTGRTASTIGMEIPDLFLESAPAAVIVHFGTTPGNEHTNGKPAGVKGCNIYRKKSGETEYSLIAFATSSPYIDLINGPAADYTYVVQYRGTKVTDVGAQSSPMTIAASGLMAA